MANGRHVYTSNTSRNHAEPGAADSHERLHRHNRLRAWLAVRATGAPLAFTQRKRHLRHAPPEIEHPRNDYPHAKRNVPSNPTQANASCVP